MTIPAILPLLKLELLLLMSALPPFAAAELAEELALAPVPVIVEPPVAPGFPFPFPLIVLVADMELQLVQPLE